MPWPRVAIFYHFLSNMSLITSKLPKIVKMFLWWPNLASEWSNHISDLALLLKLPSTHDFFFYHSVVKEKLASDIIIFLLVTWTWNYHQMLRYSKNNSIWAREREGVACENSNNFQCKLQYWLWVWFELLNGKYSFHMVILWQNLYLLKLEGIMIGQKYQKRSKDWAKTYYWSPKMARNDII